MRRINRWIVRLQRFVDRPWYMPAIALLAAADLFIVVVPTDGLVISSVMLRPKRWLAPAVWAGIGSALGALLLGGLSHYYGEDFVRAAFGNELLESANWARARDFLEKHGVYALALISWSPLPQQPAVILCGLAHMPAMGITLSVLIGRLSKYMLFAWIATHAPRLFKGWVPARKEILELEETRKSKI